MLLAQDLTLQRLSIDRPMSIALQENLHADGIELLDYLGDNNYLVRVTPALRGKTVRNTLGNFSSFADREKIAPSLFSVKDEWLAVRLFLVPGANEQQVRSHIEKLGGNFFSCDSLLRSVRCNIPTTRLIELASSKEVLWVHPLPLQRKIRDRAGKLLSDVPLIQHEGNAKGVDLTGRGVRIGIWDETIDSHPDLRDKVSVQENTMPSTGHGTHVTGIILGSGFLNTEARGMSPQARAWSYNFKFEESQPDEWDEMQEAYRKYHISLTNNSYGVAYESADCSDYESMVYDLDAPFDLLAQRLPYLTHLFAAGNERNYAPCFRKFNNGYGSSPSRGKNLIYVGAVTSDKRMTAFSSWGPMDDGRLIPTVVAHGEQVLSTSRTSGYMRLSGTSMACPAVTGQLALVTEYYGRLHNNEIPRSDLLRALVANTAEDILPEGPDYATGYGIVNSANMIEALSKQQFVLGDCSGQGEKKEYEIDVPEGTKRVRLMLVWNDAVTLRPHLWGEKALVNDLDLVVKNGEQSFLPWVLDPTNPERAAKRGEDHLNTMEQVTVEAPRQKIMVSVSATALPMPLQPYALVWYFERMPEPAFLLPRVGEQLGENFTVKMSGLTPPIHLRIMNKQRASTLKFSTLTSLSSEFFIPIASCDTLCIKAIDVNARTITSSEFHRLPIPKGLRIENWMASQNRGKLTWQKVRLPNTLFRYSICIACGADDNWQEIAQVDAATHEYEIVSDQLFGATQVAVAVRVVVGDTKGRLSEPVLTPFLLPRTTATVSSRPSLYARILFFDAMGHPLAEGANVPLNSVVQIRVYSVAERTLQRLIVHEDELLFNDEGDGYYTASYRLPTKGVYKDFCFEAQTVPAAVLPASVRLYYDSTKHLGLQVLEEGVVRATSQPLRRGTWLTFECEEKGSKRPEYFVVNGVRVDGTYVDRKLVARYHLPSNYAPAELQLDCFYTPLPVVPFTAQVYGVGASVEYTTNGAPLLPSGACVCGELLVVRIVPTEEVKVEKIVCNGVALKFVWQDGTIVAEYWVPSKADISAVHVEVYLSTSLAISAAKGVGVRVYPNPFFEQLRIDNDAMCYVTYALISATGQVVCSGRLVGHVEVISTASLPVGLYLLRIVSLTGDTTTFRIVKE